MDCPTSTPKVTKTDNVSSRGLIIIVRGSIGSGKSFLGQWLESQYSKLGRKVVIIEANDNMTTGHNNVQNYSRNRIGSAHCERQMELRTKLEMGFICVITNCSISANDIQNYTNSREQIKIGGIYGKVCERVNIEILNLLPIEFPNKRSIEQKHKLLYHSNYQGKQFFSDNELDQITTIDNVRQYYQVFFDIGQQKLFFNSVFDNGLKIENNKPIYQNFKEYVLNK